MDVKRIKKWYGQLYPHKFNDLDEVDQFFERLILSKFTQRIDNLNKPISTNKLKKKTYNLPKQKVPCPDYSLVNVTKHLRKKYQFFTLSEDSSRGTTSLFTL